MRRGRDLLDSLLRLVDDDTLINAYKNTPPEKRYLFIDEFERRFLRVEDVHKWRN